MITPQQAVDSALQEAKKLRNNLKKKKTIQITSGEETQLIQATVHAWLKNHREILLKVIETSKLKELDDIYAELLMSSKRASSRSRYDSLLKNLKDNLMTLNETNLEALWKEDDNKQNQDNPPNFSALISDPKMQTILTNRWIECVKCISSEAPLSACVMMGGMLQGLLLAKINQLPDKGPVFKAKCAPKDKLGKALGLNEWGLKDYIDVAHELGWISRTAKDVSAVLRDYRNYIHPQKELSHQIVVNPKDSKLLWEIAKNVARELISSK